MKNEQIIECQDQALCCGDKFNPIELTLFDGQQSSTTKQYTTCALSNDDQNELGKNESS